MTQPAWTPSQDRLIVVPPNSAALVRGITSATTLMMAPVLAGSDLDFSFDIGANISAVDTIATVSATVSPDTLTITDTAGSGTVATLWVDALTAGQSYLFTISITTTQGRTVVLQATLSVPGLPQMPAVVTVVTVPQSYVDDAIAALSAELSAQIAALTALVNYQPGLDFTNASSLTL